MAHYDTGDIHVTPGHLTLNKIVWSKTVLLRYLPLYIMLPPFHYIHVSQNSLLNENTIIYTLNTHMYMCTVSVHLNSMQYVTGVSRS